MLIEESNWIKEVLNKYFSENDFPILNIGSSTDDFRKIIQPHIHDNIFKPLLEENKVVFHADIKKEIGVDIVGDLNDETFRSQLKEIGIKGVICSNLLEHLIDPHKICNSILETLPDGGYIIVTVPHTFPYHKDPIDTMLRPDKETLHKFFPNTQVISSEIVVSTKCYKDDLLGNKKYLSIMIIRWLMPFYKFKDWKFMISDLFNANKKYSATCLLLKK